MNVFGIQAVSGRAGEVCKIQNLRVSAEYWKLNLTQTQFAQVWTSVYFLTKMYTDIHVHVHTCLAPPIHVYIHVCVLQAHLNTNGEKIHIQGVLLGFGSCLKEVYNYARRGVCILVHVLPMCVYCDVCTCKMVHC